MGGDDLVAFQQRHPDVTDAPSPLEVFCDLNPSNQKCLIYDD
ncbi:CP12 domain-containing protein [Synechococcus sp. GFB01]|nr:CP12 domain-containing protein [Synechococcus sp. GFB01]